MRHTAIYGVHIYKFKGCQQGQLEIFSEVVREQ